MQERSHLTFFEIFTSALDSFHSLLTSLLVRNEQICNRSILTKTDQLQTNLSSAESVLSLLQTLSLNTLRVVMPADEKQTTTDQQIICSVCR